MTDDELGNRLRLIDEGNPEGPGPDVPRRSRAEDDPRLLAKIDVNESDLKMLTAKAWDAINRFNHPPYLFANGNSAVRLVGGDHDLPTTVEDLNVDTMTRESANTAYWMKLMDKGRWMQPQFPPERVMRNMLADPKPPLPQLKRVTRAPMFGPNGELETTAGYHETTGHYYDARGLELPAVSAVPTGEEVEDAFAFLLEEYLADFPFVSRSEIAHTVSLILNPFVRDMIDGPTPLYVIESPSAGTGKGLLARLCMFPALGSEPVTMTQSDNVEEERKRITGTLLALPEAVILDNIADGLDSHNLASVLTAREWTDRILGRSATRTIPVRNTWIATGNNPSKSSELARRTIRIRLDAKAERPEERTRFKHPDIEAWARKHRGRLVHAVLTIVQGWVKAGRPRGTQTLGSYSEWAAVHGGILGFLQCNGFLENRSEDRLLTVTEDAAWSAFTDRWWEQHGSQSVGVSDLFSIARAVDDFPLGTSPSEHGQRVAFGKALTRNRNRVFNGREVVFYGHEQRAARYRLVPAGQQDLPDF